VRGAGWASKRASDLLAFVLAFAARAEAQSGLPLELSWAAPGECPSSAELQAELARVAHPRPGHVLEPVHARATVTRESRHYVLNVHTEHQGQAGERRVEAKDCKTLVRTLTLILALTFGAGVELQDEASSAEGQEGASDTDTQAAVKPEPGAPEAAKREIPSEPETSPPAGPVEASSSRWSLLAGPTVVWNLAPRVAGGFALGATFERGALVLGARTSASFAAQSSPAPHVNAHFTGFGASLRGCGRLALWQLSAGLCAGARALALRGRASGAIREASAVAPWYAATGNAFVAWPRNARFRAQLEGGLDVSLNRPRFLIQGLSEVHQVPRVVPELALLFALTL
jgi:hypothetical protein